MSGHNQFKPGDLALTLRDRMGWPPMTQVELDVFHAAGSVLVEAETGSRFRIRECAWQCRLTDGSGEDNRLYRPSELMPLRGDFTPEQQKSREVVA